MNYRDCPKMIFCILRVSSFIFQKLTEEKRVILLKQLYYLKLFYANK